MQKKALVTALLNTGFVGAGMGEGAKEFKKKLKNPDISSHDTILKNKAPEVPEVPEIKAASVIDNLYIDKVAYTPDADRDDYNPRDKGNSSSLVPKGVGAAMLLAYLGSAYSHGGNFIQPLRQAGSVAKELPHIFIDKVLKKGRVGKIFAKAIREAKDRVKAATGVGPKVNRPNTAPREDTRTNTDRVLTSMLLGAGLATGNLGVHIVGDKYFDKNTVRKSYDTATPSFSDEYKNSYHAALKQKKASEVIDEVFEKEAAYPRFANKAHFIKKLLKEDLAQNAVGTLPFFALPAAASYIAGRDLRYDAKKISRQGKDKITIDVPLSDFKKTAGMKSYLGVINKAKRAPKTPLHQSPTWKEFFKYEMPARAVRTLSWIAPATALTALTGRNLRGSLEKTDSQNKPLESGKARITIETAPHRGTDIDPKSASSMIDGIYKEAIAVQVKKNEIRE